MGTPTTLKLTCIKYLGTSACIFYTYSTTACAIGKNILLGMIPAALYTYILYAARTCVVLCGKFSRDSIFVDRPSLPFNSSQMSVTMPVQLCLFQWFIFVASRLLVKIVPRSWKFSAVHVRYYMGVGVGECCYSAGRKRCHYWWIKYYTCTCTCYTYVGKGYVRICACTYNVWEGSRGVSCIDCIVHVQTCMYIHCTPMESPLARETIPPLGLPLSPHNKKWQHLPYLHVCKHQMHISNNTSAIHTKTTLT